MTCIFKYKRLFKIILGLLLFLCMIKLNITFALLFKILMLILGLIVITSRCTVITDVCVCFATILNSLCYINF